MILDLVEVACSHSGINLAAAFAKILEDFGISDKASESFQKILINLPDEPTRYSPSPVITHLTMTL